MQRSNIIVRGACISALALLVAGPALAEGKGDRAQEAIARASGKIDAANKVGVGGEVPGMIARAQAALDTAKEDAASGHKEAAIADANNASQLADTALGVAQKRRTD